MKKTKIICTIGPASSSVETIEAMINAGMNVARLNMSHGDHEQHLGYITLLKELRNKLNKPLGIMLDTKGPEFRIKQFREGSAYLVEGETFILTTGNVKGDHKMVSVTYKDLPKVVKAGDTILLNDGFIELEVESVTKYDVITKVVVGGRLYNNKSITLPGVVVDMPYLSAADKEDLRFAIENDVEFIALSFVRTAEDVELVKKFIDDNGGKKKNIKLISKIENQQGVDHIDSIIMSSDGIMVARGDLGVEVDLNKIPVYQKTIVDKCLKYGKMVIIATQMLESMIESPRPTRAEVNDVATAVLDGATAVMLSGETAAGKNVVKSIQTMSNIIETCEKSFIVKTRIAQISEESSTSSAIAYACKSLADAIKPDAIIVETVSGASVYNVSGYRPNSPIIACTCDNKVYNQLALCWGAYPVMIDVVNDTDNLLEEAKKVSLLAGLVKKGNTVIQTAGLPIGSGETNLLKIDTI